MYNYYIQNRRLCSTAEGHAPASRQELPIIYYGDNPTFALQFPSGVLLSGDLVRLAIDIDHDITATSPMAMASIILEEASTSIDLSLWTRTERFQAVINGHRTMPCCLQIIRYRPENIEGESQMVGEVLCDDFALAKAPVVQYGDACTILPQEIELPSPTATDAGKLLGVSASGAYILMTGGGGGGGTITVDAELSTTSENPVQNKVITNALNGKQATISSSNKLPYSYLSGTPTIPTTLSALSDDSTHRLVTDAEKSAWDAKSDFSGSYNDLTNKPTIPAAQVQADWNVTSTTSKAFIKNKPTIPTVNNPTITFTQGGVTKGSITLNQSGNQNIPLDAGGGGSWDGTFAEVVTADASLTVSPAHSYKWTLTDASGTLSARASAADYSIPIDIYLDNSTVTLSGLTFKDTLISNMLNRCLIVKRADGIYLYVYDIAPLT